MNKKTVHHLVVFGYLCLGLYLLGSAAWVWLASVGALDPALQPAAQEKLDNHLLFYCFLLISGVLTLKQVMDYIDGTGPLRTLFRS